METTRSAQPLCRFTLAQELLRKSMECHHLCIVLAQPGNAIARVARSGGLVARVANFLNEYPKKYSEAEVEEMLNGGYFKPPPVPFWAGEDQMTIKPGATVLWVGWEGLEYFHCKVDGWEGDRIVVH